MNEIVKRAPDGKWVKGTRGGPGKKPMPPEVREMLYGAGEKAIQRMHHWVMNDEEYDKTDPELKLRLLTTVTERAYGKAAIVRDNPDGEDAHLSAQQVASVLDEVYAKLKAPELRYAMRADRAKDVTDAEEVEE